MTSSSHITWPWQEDCPARSRVRRRPESVGTVLGCCSEAGRFWVRSLGLKVASQMLVQYRFKWVTIPTISLGYNGICINTRGARTSPMRRGGVGVITQHISRQAHCVSPSAYGRHGKQPRTYTCPSWWLNLSCLIIEMGWSPMAS
jgi:hypothetical protein